MAYKKDQSLKTYLGCDLERAGLFHLDIGQAAGTDCDLADAVLVCLELVFVLNGFLITHVGQDKTLLAAHKRLIKKIQRLLVVASQLIEGPLLEGLVDSGGKLALMGLPAQEDKVFFLLVWNCDLEYIEEVVRGKVGLEHNSDLIGLVGLNRCSLGNHQERHRLLLVFDTENLRLQVEFDCKAGNIHYFESLLVSFTNNYVAKAE